MIDRSDYCRLDLSNHTQDEFMRRNVPELLGGIIEAMKALDIAPRFAADRERRDSEIMRCEAVIKRWRGLHGPAVHRYCGQQTPYVLSTGLHNARLV